MIIQNEKKGVFRMSAINISVGEANDYNQTQSVQVNAVKNENDVKKENKSSTNETTVTAAPQDTVEISKEGYQAYAKSVVKTGDNNQVKEGKETENKTAASKSTGEVKGTEDATSSSSESESVSDSELYSKTESQLINLKNEGSITQRQYDNEMAKRGGGEA